MVSEGNICRSPIAAVLLASGMPQFDVTSAGTHALIGHGESPVAVQLMGEIGLDIRTHVAPLTPELARSDHLLLTMIRVHHTLVETNDPHTSGKADFR